MNHSVLYFAPAAGASHRRCLEPLAGVAKRRYLEVAVKRGFSGASSAFCRGAIVNIASIAAFHMVRRVPYAHLQGQAGAAHARFGVQLGGWVSA